MSDLNTPTNADAASPDPAPQAPVAVTQADRNFAADHGVRFGRFGELYRRVIEDGRWDHTDDVQMVAQFRQTSTAALEAEIGRLREALEPFAREADAQERVTSFSSGESVIPRTKITIGQLRRARLALAHQETTDGGK